MKKRSDSDNISAHLACTPLNIGQLKITGQNHVTRDIFHYKKTDIKFESVRKQKKFKSRSDDIF